jgi:hypothetical protein
MMSVESQVGLREVAKSTRERNRRPETRVTLSKR